ncbi:UBIQUITIN-CONJUGAT-2 domain-containing protein [Aphelenchoides fujianensis]|nr:UBIQUITIN-CONJUGAT-2 domain-containing protein [Aphelenchoides fujianensis]
MGGPSLNAVKRLKKDYQKLVKDPVPYAIAAPLQSDILEWHYVIFGAPDTPYDGGYYHGKFVFPADFPFRPPSIYMITPSGRFQTNTRLCLSISDFHPDTWNPSWTVSSILTGLMSFMNETAQTLGSINTTTQEKKLLARRSREYNLRDPVFCAVFEELAAKLRAELEEERRLQGMSEQTAASESEGAQNGEDGGKMRFAIRHRPVWVTSLVLVQVLVFYLGRWSGEKTVDGEVRASEPLALLGTSAPGNVDERQTVRETWLRAGSFSPADVRPFFAVGTKNTTANERKRLEAEHEEHGDLLFIEKLVDSFDNLSKKTAYSIESVVKSHDFKYVMKTDTDSFVRVGHLLKALRDVENPHLYWGFLDGRAKPFRRGKYKEPGYVVCDRYLPYHLGGGYVLAHSLAAFIADHTHLLRYYRSEDVSVGVWLAGVNVKYVHDPRFDTEYISRGCNNRYLVTHKHSKRQMHEYADSIRTTGRLCAREFQSRLSYVYDFAVPPSHCCSRVNGSNIP